MLSAPILKFEKSTNYLNEQLDIQLNNKKLVSDIISNINVILEDVALEENTSYLNIKITANSFLHTISENITTIEELNREVKHITSDLTEVLEETNKKEKSKEYYIAAISSVKNNIEIYTSKFQEFVKKLESDNISFNNFIDENNVKYNFISQKDDGSFEFSGFSIDDKIIKNLAEDPSLSIDFIASLKNKYEFKETASDDIDDTEEISNSNTTEPTEEIQRENEILEEISEEDILETIEVVPEENTDVVSKENTIEAIEVVPEENTVETIEIPENNNFIENSANNSLSALLEEQFLNTNNGFSNNFGIFENDDFNENDTSTENIVTNENIDISDDTLLNELLEEDLLAGNMELPDDSKNDDISDDDLLLSELLEKELLAGNVEVSNEPENDNISDDDLLNELLEEELLSGNIEVLDNSKEDEISDDDLLNDLLLSNILEEQLLAEPTQEPEAEITTPTENTSYNFDEKIDYIENAVSNNYTLIISEKRNKVYLPYTIDELEQYLRIYPDVYPSLRDAVSKEFILSLDIFSKHAVQSRFLETYNLIRNREGKSIIYSVFSSLKLLYKRDLNPAVIAACKTEEQLTSYLDKLSSNTLEKFEYFKILYEVNPL